jgi:hypothetical protein
MTGSEADTLMYVTIKAENHVPYRELVEYFTLPAAEVVNLLEFCTYFSYPYTDLQYKVTVISLSSLH